LHEALTSVTASKRSLSFQQLAERVRNTTLPETIQQELK